jgi:predicted transcriptional regulator
MKTINGVQVTERLARRHHESAIVSCLILECLQQMYPFYPRRSRRKNGTATRSAAIEVDDVMVAMAIRCNDHNGGDPYTIAAIVKQLKLPRSNVVRSLGRLVSHQVIDRIDGHHYLGNLNFLEARIDAPYFRKIRTAIFVAARDLKKAR